MMFYLASANCFYSRQMTNSLLLSLLALTNTQTNAAHIPLPIKRQWYDMGEAKSGS